MVDEQVEILAVVDHEAAQAKAQADHEAQIEQQQIEQVFGLTGGELESSPWEPFESKEDGEYMARTVFRYWYEGAPDYASELTRGADFDEHRTVVTDCSPEPEYLFERGTRWERVESYVSSGETDCPCSQDREEDNFTGTDLERPTWCELCDSDEADDGHYIYIGDGWCETVYRGVPTCTTCGVDLTDEDREAYDGVCDDHFPHVFDVWSGRTDGRVYQGSSGPAALLAYMAEYEPDGHYVVLRRDGVTLAESECFDP